MNLRPCVAATVLALLTSISHAQDRTAGDLGKAKFGKATEAKAPVATGEWITPNSVRQVLAREFTIFPGTTAFFEWLADLSGSDRVGISITTFSDPNSRLSQVRIGVAYAAPGDWYVLTDVILGSSFYYIDHGGATVPVYGPRMKIAVSNDGNTPVRITQLAAYAVAR